LISCAFWIKIEILVIVGRKEVDVPDGIKQTDREYSQTQKIDALVELVWALRLELEIARHDNHKLRCLGRKMNVSS
jgi:hypothetical protein